LAQSAEALGDRALAIEARRTLLMMNPLDVADQRYQLAKLLVAEKQLPEARMQVVEALEQAPRFLEAHKLLLEITGNMDQQGMASPWERMPATLPTTQPAKP
jgi:hypothetical protein